MKKNDNRLAKGDTNVLFEDSKENRQQRETEEYIARFVETCESTLGKKAKKGYLWTVIACTYVFAVNQGKNPDEALNIADELFVSIMRGNKIKPEIMFTEKRNIKPVIINEVAERTPFCKEATEKAVP